MLNLTFTAIIVMVGLFPHLTPQIIESNQLQTVKKEFRLFMKKYESNSCIMDIFSDFQNQCEEIDDRLTNIIAYRMTMCIYKGLNKRIETDGCNINLDSSSCIRQLEGDSWTTFITFTQHTDNLCFYYKTLIYEKSTEFLFTKLLNSSLSVLNELQGGAVLAEKILTFQQDFSNQLNDNLVDTIEKFKNINSFLEHYAKLEEELKANMGALEVKLTSNNEKVNGMVEYFNNKFELFRNLNVFIGAGDSSVNSVNFYFAILLMAFIFTLADCLSGIRLLLMSLIVCFFLIERYYISLLFNHSSFLDLSQLYYILIFYALRLVYIVVLASIMYIRYSSHKRKANEVSLMYSDCKSYFNITPAWMRKYFTRMKMQNDYLLEKFRVINKIIEADEYEIDSE
jgi:hypothetical protein